MGLELVLVRHGVTDWNTRRVLQGHSNVPLSEEGHRQADLLGRYAVTLPPPDLLYSSDLARARETAEYLARVWNLPLNLTSELRERGFGDYEGRDWDEVQAELHQQAITAELDDQRFCPPGGESRELVEKRLLQFMGRLLKQHQGQRVWVVSHRGIIRNVLRRLVRNDADHLSSGFHIPNTSISTLRLDERGWRAVSLVAGPHLLRPQDHTQETRVEALLQALLERSNDESAVLEVEGKNRK